MSIIEFTKRIFKEQKLRFSLAIAALVIASLAEGLGIVLLLPLLQMISDGGGQMGGEVGRVGQALENFFLFLGVPLSLTAVLIFILFVALTQQGLMMAQQKIAFGSQFLFEASLRERTYRAIFNATWPFFVKTRLGYITDTLATQVTRCGTAYQTLNQLLSGIVISLVYLSLAIALSWRAASIIVIGGSVVMLLLWRQTRGGKIYGAEITRRNREFQDEITEQLSAAKLIIGYAAQETVIKRFRKYYETLAHSMYSGNINNALIRALMETGMTVILVLTIYGAVVSLRIEIAELVVFLFIFYRMAPRLSNAQAHIHRLNILIPSLEKVDLLEREALEMKETSGTRKLEQFKKGISFSNASFSYVSDHPVLKGVSLNIPKGKTVAVVGSSGVGKSTLVDLIIGLVQPDEGTIALDDIPLREYDLSTWKEKIGYVAQDSILFNDTVEANISWSYPGADREQVIAAAKLAYAHEFISDLPAGYETIIGTRGIRLSGGQRQRLALARAVIRKPEFLILDEATSALDAVSEKKIQMAVESLAKSITILIVTHRLATIKKVDYIYVLEDGKVVEQGIWEELSNAGGRFYEQRRLQSLQ